MGRNEGLVLVMYGEHGAGGGGEGDSTNNAREIGYRSLNMR